MKRRNTIRASSTTQAPSWGVGGDVLQIAAGGVVPFGASGFVGIRGIRDAGPDGEEVALRLQEVKLCGFAERNLRFNQTQVFLGGLGGLEERIAALVRALQGARDG